MWIRFSPPLLIVMLKFKILKIHNKSVVHASTLQLSPKCRLNWAEMFICFELAGIIKSITLFFSKIVKLIKPYSSHSFCTIDTKIAPLHLQTVLHKPSSQIFQHQISSIKLFYCTFSLNKSTCSWKQCIFGNILNSILM